MATDERLLERAAHARREAAEDTHPEDLQRARRALPLETSRTRSVTCPVVMRSVMEQRSIGGGAERDWLHLSGVASLVETPYEMWDMFGPYMETVKSSGFDASLSRNPDVAFLVNHSGMTMARTINETLKLNSPLNMDAWLNPARHDVSDLKIAIDDGCIDQMSFAAMMVDGQWNDDFTEFTMLELDLHCGDVSAVNFGANPRTSISARAHRILDEMDRLPSGAARAALRQLEQRFDIKPQVIVAPASGRAISLVRSALLADDD